MFQPLTLSTGLAVSMAWDGRRPVHGLVFLFKYQSAPALETPPAAADDSRVFFAQQVIPNACATQVGIAPSSTDQFVVNLMLLVKFMFCLYHIMYIYIHTYIHTYQVAPQGAWHAVCWASAYAILLSCDVVMFGPLMRLRLWLDD